MMVRSSIQNESLQLNGLDINVSDVIALHPFRSNPLRTHTVSTDDRISISVRVVYGIFWKTLPTLEPTSITGTPSKMRYAISEASQNLPPANCAASTRTLRNLAWICLFQQHPSPAPHPTATPWICRAQ